MKHIEVRLLVVSVISISFETGNRRVTKTFIGLASFGVSVIPWELPSYFQNAFFFNLKVESTVIACLRIYLDKGILDTTLIHDLDQHSLFHQILDVAHCMCACVVEFQCRKSVSMVPSLSRHSISRPLQQTFQ